MSRYGTWIFAASDGPISATQTIQRLSTSTSEVEDWPAKPGWSAALCTDLLTNDFESLVNNLSADLGAPVAAGWSDNGMIFTGCLSGKPGAQLAIGFNLSGDDLYDERANHPAR